MFVKRNRKSHLLLRSILFISLLTAGCAPLKHLKKGQFLLYKEKTEGHKKLSSSELTTLYQEKTNKKLFGTLPLVSLYYFGSHFFDSSKVQKKMDRTKEKYDKKIKENENNIKKKDKYSNQKEKKLDKLHKKLTDGNWIMKMGEPPAIYDSIKINKTEKLLEHKLISEGFFEGTEKRKEDTIGKKINVTYKIYEGEPFIISSVLYLIDDKNIDSLVKSNRKKSFLKEGERYKETNLTAERDRLTKLIKDHGYYEFIPSYIYFNIDTTENHYSIKLQTVIQNPPGKNEHAVYSIDSVSFITNQSIIDSTENYDTTIYNNIKYLTNKNLKFSKKILDRRIRIHPGGRYSQTAAQKTQKNLSRLEMYRSVSIRFTPDTTKKTLTATIKTNTLKKQQIVTEAGVNVSQSFVPGPFGSIRYKERNVFKGFEMWELNLKASIAAQASVLDPTSVLRTEEYSAFTSLSFPQLFIPGLRSTRWDNYYPGTRILAGYTITRRPEYERATARTGLVYNINPDENRQIIFSPVDINLINTARISDTFRTYLRDLQTKGNNLIYSFQSSYVSDINLSYIFNNSTPTENKKSKYIQYYFESGGTIFNLIRTETFLGLKTFRYIKFNTDFRYYFPVGEKNTFAMRFNLGIADPYSSSHTLPYEKYFFAGGPNSIRAWKLRRLGPGSYAQVDSSTGQISYKIERPGEILFETSYEYRFKIMGFLEGAAFIDAGNTWMIKKDPARPGAQFQLNSFFKQIAVGTGIGLRLNFSFVILRFDLGIKAYDPAVQKFVLFSSALNQGVINVGIGYPF